MTVTDPPTRGADSTANGSTCMTTRSAAARVRSRLANCPRMVSGPPKRRYSTASSSTTHSSGGFGPASTTCRASRFDTICSSRSPKPGRALRNKARAYASVCNRPGTVCGMYFTIVVALASYCTNLRCQSGGSSRFVCPHRSRRSPSASRIASSASDTSLGGVSLPSSNWAMRLCAMGTLSPNWRCVQPARVRSLRSFMPYSAARDRTGQVPWARALAPLVFVLALRKPLALPSVARCGNSWDANDR